MQPADMEHFTDRLVSTDEDPVQNKYDATKKYSHTLAYNERRYPYAPQNVSIKPAPRIGVQVFNLPFERSLQVENDLKVLFSYLSSIIMPLHAQECQIQMIGINYFAQVVGIDVRFDTLSMGVNNRGQTVQAKVRHIIVETNYPLLNELLHCPKLQILADKNCFHVCWDGLIEGDTLTHCARDMWAFCDSIRGMGLRARHRATGGLPCTSLRFDVQPFSIMMLNI